VRFYLFEQAEGVQAPPPHRMCPVPPPHHVCREHCEHVRLTPARTVSLPSPGLSSIVPAGVSLRGSTGFVQHRGPQVLFEPVKAPVPSARRSC